jgi:hypothetical protein
MQKDITMDKLDPARTALVLVHIVKGVAGEVDTPFNRIFRARAEKTGIVRVQARLLESFRTAKAKVVYTLVTYQPGSPRSSRTPRCSARSPAVIACWRALPQSRSSTT